MTEDRPRASLVDLTDVDVDPATAYEVQEVIESRIYFVATLL